MRTTIAKIDITQNVYSILAFYPSAFPLFIFSTANTSRLYIFAFQRDGLSCAGEQVSIPSTKTTLAMLYPTL